MPKTRVSSPAVAEPPPGRWSNAIRAGDFLFISGMVSRAKDGKTIEGRGDIPASTLVQVAALGTPEILVEIEAVAHIGGEKGQ